MKRLIKFRLCLILIIMIPCSSVVFGAQINYQQVIPVSSPVWQLLEDLYLLSGRASPSSSGPWNAQEILVALEYIDAEQLDSAAYTLYQEIEGMLQPRQLLGAGSGFAMNFSGEANINAIGHTRPDFFDKESDWISPSVSETPLLKGAFETWVSSFAYGYAEIGLGFTSPVASILPDGKNDNSADIRYSSYFATNIPFISPGSISMNFPSRGVLSFGGPHWSVIAGRDVVKWGTGKTGNLMIGGNLPFNDMVQVSAYNNWFKYTFLLSFFVHPMNVTKNHTEAITGLQFLMAHRLEFRFWKDKINFVLQEAIMYQSTDGTLDWRILNPFLIFHNYYISGNANSLAGFEFDITPIKGLNLYFQFVMDDAAVSGEPVPPAAGASPNAFGYLFGIQGRIVHGSGYWFGSLEGAYTDPFLYLRERTVSGELSLGYLDYIGYVREFDPLAPGQTRYIRRYIGYGYGGDAAVADLRFGYRQPQLWEVEAGLFFMAHGVIRSDSTYGYYNGTGQYVPSTPSTGNPFDGEVENQYPVEYTLVSGLKGRWKPLSWLAVSMGVDVVTQWNRLNIASVANTDVQFSIGVTLSI